MKKTLTQIFNAFCRTTLVLGCVGFFSGCDAPSRPLARAGQLDLSQWEFALRGPVALSGEYEFYWQQHLPPDFFLNTAPPTPTGIIHVPGVWNDYQHHGQRLPGEGYATYRLRIQLKEAQPLALKFLDMATAFTVYVNGMPLLYSGQAGTVRERTSPRYFPQVVEFTPVTRELELILHVSNFHHKKGGPWEIIELGLARDLHHARSHALQLDIFLFGCIVIMGLYHLGLFAVRTDVRAPLFFGVFCLLLAVRLSVISERLALQFFPNLPWELLGKIEYLVYYLAPPTGAALLYALYQEDFSRRILRLMQSISAVFCLIVLLTPVRVFSYTVATHHAYTVLCSIYGVIVIMLAAQRGREGARFHFIGFSILCLTIINDILQYFQVLATPLLLPFGLLAFILSQAVVLAMQFSHAFRTIDWQRGELEKAIRQYERELIEKRRLEVQYRTLYNDNPTMYFTVDANGVVLSVNQYGLKYLGYKADDLVGRNVVNVFHEDDIAKVPRQLEICVQEPQRVHEWELRKRRKDGSIIWVREVARCVQNAAGQPLLLIVCEDITARKQAEEELHTSRERLRALNVHLQALLEQERGEVARHLHETLGQAFASLQRDLTLLAGKIETGVSREEAPGLLQQIEGMQNLLQTQINKVRDSVTELRGQ